MADALLAWLMEGDVSVRWQAERDLLDAPTATWTRTRSRIADEGWGRELLSRQDPNGTWAEGLYSPKWTSTTYTLLLLRRFGLSAHDEQARRGCEQLLDRARWVDGGVSYWRSHRHPELCVNAMVLSVCAHFGVVDPRVASIADLMMRRRMDDGGWNCLWPEGASHSSFHTTISALEALRLWSHHDPSGAVASAIEDGQEFMLEHRMFRSHRSGEVIDATWMQPHFPPRWHYDVLRGLDHLAGSRVRPDERCSDAIDVVTGGRRLDGRWGTGSQYGGRTFLTMEPGRTAGRWNTLRALRILRWWEEIR